MGTEALEFFKLTSALAQFIDSQVPNTTAKIKAKYLKPIRLHLDGSITLIPASELESSSSSSSESSESSDGENSNSSMSSSSSSDSSDSSSSSSLNDLESSSSSSDPLKKETSSSSNSFYF